MELRKAQFSDWELLLDWRNDAETRANSHQQAIVETQAHKDWLARVINNSDRELFLAVADNQPVGTVRADKLEDGSYELSWTISPQARGKGYGKQMINLVVSHFPEATSFRAEVKVGNTASEKIALAGGLKKEREEKGVSYYAK